MLLTFSGRCWPRTGGDSPCPDQPSSAEREWGLVFEFEGASASLEDQGGQFEPEPGPEHGFCSIPGPVLLIQGPPFQFFLEDGPPMGLQKGGVGDVCCLGTLATPCLRIFRLSCQKMKSVPVAKRLAKHRMHISRFSMPSGQTWEKQASD